MYTRLGSFINRFDIISNRQFGFRAGHSTILALIDLIDSISTSISQKHFTVGVFLDLNSNTLRTLYFSLIYPYIYYGNIICASTCPTNLNRIRILQKRISSKHQLPSLNTTPTQTLFLNAFDF